MVVGDSILRNAGAAHADMTVECFPGIETEQLHRVIEQRDLGSPETVIIPYPTAFPYGNGMVLHFYQQQESSTTKTVHKVINKGLKAYV